MDRTLLPGGVVAILTIGASLGAVQFAQTQVFPIRLADESEPEPAAPVVVSEILDPYQQKIAIGFGIFQSVSETVPFSAVTPRCGDDDGCRLRLIARRTFGLQRADDMEARLFSVSGTGTSWLITNDEGTLRSDGSTTDTVSKTLMEVCFGDCDCILQDSGIRFEYQLVLRNGADEGHWQCLLRIDD